MAEQRQLLVEDKIILKIDFTQHDVLIFTSCLLHIVF